MPEYITEELDEAGAKWQILPNLESAAEWADILYMTRVQRERFDDVEFAKIQGKFNLHAATLANAKPNLRVLHPLPRMDEIAPDVDARRMLITLNKHKTAYLRVWPCLHWC